MVAAPASLQKGDKVAIVSTARKISKEELGAAITKLENWGLKVELGENLFASQHQLAGTDAERLQDFQTALNNSEIKAIICARGGYGTVRIIDEIDFSAFQNNPKWIVGYSDITALHSHIHNTFGIPTLHATMPINFSSNTEDALQSLKDALFGNGYEINVEVEAQTKNRKGNCEGILVGGNLSMLYSLRGTNSDLQTNGKILFLEDLDEYLYHIDRMMMNLKRGEMLSDLTGLIVGGMSDMNDNAVPFGKTAEEIIWEHVAEYNYPVCFGFPAGHIDDNRALVMGKRAQLSVSTTSVKFIQHG